MKLYDGFTVVVLLAWGLFSALSFGGTAIVLTDRPSTPRPQFMSDVCLNNAATFGEVIWFNVERGYGVVVTDDGRRIFVYAREVRRAGIDQDVMISRQRFGFSVGRQQSAIDLCL